MIAVKRKIDGFEFYETIFNIIYETILQWEELTSLKKDPLNKFKRGQIRHNLSIWAENHINHLIEDYEKENSFIAKVEKCKTRHEKKNILIDEYCKKLKELAELNSELYNMTELYEDEFMLEFDHELFTIFKNKVGYYTRLYNKIKELT